MTDIVLPNFLLKLFEAEMNKSFLAILRSVCEKYNLSYEEVEAFVGERIYTQVDVEKDVKHRITKVYPRRPVLVENRCCARYYNKDLKEVTQCKRSMKRDGFCMTHYSLWKQNYLRYGTVDNPIEGDSINFGVIKKIDRLRVEP